MQCYLCHACGKSFSQQTFACTYFMKRPELLEPIAAGLVAGSAHRQIARSQGCAPSTVTRIAARLGRHGILLLARGLEQLPAIPEPVVYDDFVTFYVSQDLPCGLGTAVGGKSWFVYGIEHAPHRRGGRRAARKQAPRHSAPQPERGAFRKAFHRTLDLLVSKRIPGTPLEVISDGHSGYKSAYRDHPARAHIVHRTYPNPSKRPSPEASLRDREMFPVDLLHSLMRHSLAHYHRETIAFGRRLNALLERTFLMAVWRNWVKGVSERKPDPTTPAMRIGLAEEPWSWKKVLARRLFRWRIAVPEAWIPIYRRELITPEIGPNTLHRLIYAD